ncbi:hypothetical protein [Streptacidiphilus jiangxiensis]|uniref:PBP domain-containing protein n=1 Tax=Streptacidiphilus jiangxiensis TaxID=235985 RepID=A0A1H7LXD6_STRJI|nr:hypothetical protein [Streptacidiphilus jiangxiensis]SEL03601.1 hypothetical protein SAMN05414137_10582 [Streptacidiphilus jiangxiensis]
MGSRHVRAGGLLAAMFGATLLLVAGVLPQAVTAQAAPAAGAAVAAAGGSAVTVQGPPVWQPAKGTYGPRGTVTVAQTRNLTDQVVHVSWTGFTPTVNSDGSPALVDPGVANVQVASSIFYGVRVYECRGTTPAVTDCYGSTQYGATASKGFQQPQPPAGSTTPEFPSNEVLAVTRPDGTGEADIEVWTAHESQTLGCDPKHACSLVIEPNYGGDAIGVAQFLGAANPGCGNHTWDTDIPDGVTEASDANFAASDFETTNADGEQCAWNNRVVVPLGFASTPTDCQARAADFSVQGLEMASRIMQSWRSGFCQGSSPISVQYTSTGGEPQARQAFLNRVGPDVALTAYPDTSPAPRPYVYAPLATNGIVVAFRVDDSKTGVPITSMKLNARLLAKQLTQSYVGSINPDEYDSTKGNPACIYEDPEFLKLNPTGTDGPNWPSCSSANAGAALPIVVGGTTDLVQQLTSWIAADPDAASFLAGQPDPWGMHVDTHYLKPAFAGYPVNAFIPQDQSASTGTGDPKPSKTYEWVPQLGGLVQVARGILAAQPASLQWSPDQTGNHPRITPELVGSRSVMAVVDAGQAAAFSLPQAQLLNPAGAYVGPGTASLGAAVGDMATNPSTGTAMLPYTSPSSTGFATDKQAYPLTTVQYAMLPTQGVQAAKVAKIVAFLDRAGSPTGGQQAGFQPGQLAPGFVPLTAAQRAQLTAATCDLQRQDGQKPGNQSATSPCSNRSGSGGGAGTAGTTGGGTAGGTTGGTAAGTTGGATGGTASGTGTSGGAKPQALASTQPVAVGTPDLNRVGGQRLLLPILLIAGAVLLVGGPATLVLTGTDAGTQLWRGSRRTWRSLRGRVTRRG